MLIGSARESFYCMLDVDHVNFGTSLDDEALKEVFYDFDFVSRNAVNGFIQIGTGTF